DLRNIAPGYSIIAGIFALGGKGDKEFSLRFRLPPRRFHSTLFQQRNQYILRCTGVSRAFKNNKLPFLEIWSDRLGRLHDVAQIRLVVLVQRCGHADDYRVHLTDTCKIGCSAETAPTRGLDLVRQNTEDVGSTFIQSFNFIMIDIKPGDRELLLTVEQGQRQAYIAEADNAYLGSTAFDTAS